MIIQIEKYITLFFIYSIAGWIMETVQISVREKKFINRGFLIGPYCPIYGCGVLLITLLLQKYSDDILITFILSILICGILEYLTSYIMEKIFKARWWDYSQRKFNINGRICLETLIPFGLAGTFILYVTNPFFLKYIEMIPDVIMHVLTGLFLVIYVTDLIVSFKIILNLKEMKKELKDNTMEISEKVGNIILKKLRLYRRLVNAFPRVKDNVKFATWNDIKIRIEESKNEIKTKIDNSKEELKNKFDASKVEIGEIIQNSRKNLKKESKRKKEKDEEKRWL